MSWEEVFKKHVIWAEDRRNDVYPDSKGIPTVGIGHNLRDHPKVDIPPTIGFMISDERIDQLFEEDSYNAVHMVTNIFHSEFDSWSDNRKAGIVDLVFNLGATTFLTFGPTISHIRAGQWADVAKHMEGSAWYKQVGRRGPKVCKMLREG